MGYLSAHSVTLWHAHVLAFAVMRAVLNFINGNYATPECADIEAEIDGTFGAFSGLITRPTGFQNVVATRTIFSTYRLNGIQMTWSDYRSDKQAIFNNMELGFG